MTNGEAVNDLVDLLASARKIVSRLEANIDLLRTETKRLKERVEATEKSIGELRERLEGGK